jgi:hypothetical protein
MLDHSRVLERRHERASLAHARGPLGRLIQVVDRLPGEARLSLVVARVSNLTKGKARGIRLWVTTHRPAPSIVVPRHADGDMS